MAKGMDVDKLKKSAILCINQKLQRMELSQLREILNTVSAMVETGKNENNFFRTQQACIVYSNLPP